jgi:hypothetical protein
MVLFLKTAMRIHVDAYLRTIVVLTGGKLTGIYFLQFTFFVTTYLHQGKKVSLLPPGDVNPGPVLSSWDCLRIVPIMQ